MAKLRLIVGEVEGDDASVQAAIRGMSEVMNPRQPASVPVAIVGNPEALPAPPTKRGRKAKELPAASNGNAATGAILPTDGTTTVMILTALKGGAKTSAQVLAACPKLNASQVYQTLSVLRLKRRVVVKVDDEDGGQKKNYLAQ